MIRKISVLFLAFAIISVAFAQNKNVVDRRMKIPTDNINQTVSPDYSHKLNKTMAIGELFINSAYDYAANSDIPKMIALADIDGDGTLDPMFTAMQRTPLSASGDRLVMFGYKAFAAPIDAFNAFDPALTSVGWGTLQYLSGGPLDGNAMVMGHAGGVGRNTTIDLVNLTPVTPFSTGSIPGNFPDFVYQPDGTIWGAGTNLIYKSTDQGATFTEFAALGAGDSNVDITSIDSPSETPIYTSDDGMNMAIVTAPATFAVDTLNPDVVYWYGTNDGGASWNGLIIGQGSGTFPKYGQVVNNLDYAPYFTNFGQTNANVDNTGAAHVVANGYGERKTATDTTNYFPIVYWNSNDAQWMEISIPAVAEPTDGFGHLIAGTDNLYPGNGIGQAYPSVSVSGDGQVVFVIWAAPEYTGTIGASEYNIYPGDGGTATAPKYYTDLHWTVSTDGGSTWSAVSPLGEASLSETYPSVARRLDIQPNGDVIAHFVYYVDPIPGTSLFAAENGPTPDGAWQYVSAVVANYSPATDIPVTFQVDMGVQAFEGNFPAGANVVVRGNFQAAAGDTADWQGNMFQLADADGDTIYTGTFNMPASFAGTAYLFKYVIVNPPAGDNWEADPNRTFTLTAPSTVVPVDCFNRDCEYTVVTEVTNTVKFVADISGIIGVGVGGAFDPNQDSLQVMGLDWDALGKNIVGNRTMYNNDPFNTGIYDATLTFTSGSGAPNGVGDSTKWKFKAYPDGRFANTGWETTPDRWHIYLADGSSIELPAIAPNILPLFGPIGSDVPITITVDMTGATNRYNGLTIPLNELEFVGMRGAADFLGSWSAGGNWTPSDTTTGLMKVLQNIGGNLWRISVTAPAGTNAGQYAYKFAAMYPGADTVNNGGSPLDNENPNDFNHTFILADNPAGITLWTNWADITTDVKEIDDLVPFTFELGQNYPNPFNPSTTIKFSVPEAGLVTLRVFNLLGQEVAMLLNSEKTAGVYEATFDASRLSSGVYFYTLEAKNFSSTKKMVLLK